MATASTTALRRGKPHTKPETSTMLLVDEREPLMETTTTTTEVTGMGVTSGTSAISAPSSLGVGGGASSTTIASGAAAGGIGLDRYDVMQQQHQHQQQFHHRHAIPTAVVRRRFCGTGPFDRHWLNLDCCGLTCAAFTYILHLYGVYAICFILLPPWMSYDLELAGSSHSVGGAPVTATSTGNLSATSTTMRVLSWAGRFHQAAFTIVAILAILSHFKAMTTDPGAVPPDAKPLEENTVTNRGDNNANQDDATPDPAVTSSIDHLSSSAPPKTMRLCRRCKAYKPQRAHHCSVCRRCIIKMDHHCPWVNNCVGLGNHKYFLLFVFYTFVSCVYSMVLIIARFATCMGMPSSSSRHAFAHGGAAAGVVRDATCLDEPSHLLNILGLLVEALLFGLFTSCMMCDQFEVIHSKMTHIDRLKGTDVGGSLPGILEVFGAATSRLSKATGADTRFRADWLSPLHKVCFPESVQDEVFGFCRPCTQMMKKSTLISGTPSKPQDFETTAVASLELATKLSDAV